MDMRYDRKKVVMIKCIIFMILFVLLIIISASLLSYSYAYWSITKEHQLPVSNLNDMDMIKPTRIEGDVAIYEECINPYEGLFGSILGLSIFSLVGVFIYIVVIAIEYD